MRRRTYHVLTGSLLGVWSHLEGVFARFPSQNHKMQIIRVHCDKKKLVGKYCNNCERRHILKLECDSNKN